MKRSGPQSTIKSIWFLAALAALASTPVLADTTANFGKLALSPGFESTKGTIAGYTGGSYSLSAISNRDRNRNVCIGYADPKPDHILILEKDFSRLKIQVDTGGADTTLVIQGPDNSIVRCGDDTGRNKDASITDTTWKAGTYRIWVGTFKPGERRNYRLKIQEQS
ncbi:hypothetical protein WA1_30760 [Scytonema hofmannii PCC 7110]|uniref:Peptidase S1 n=1 Tax=Scytonema hofmannii PCC 7110 TaxID=128403 RepID=A0A139X4Z1_9CYAN|nr:hypothetical protein [Scytonema hofmannii]KYC39713.1 hypothetical protein WA1_30760 [Scytonema hofmannii PCC 7110]